MALIYDISLDMIEYRVSFFHLIKQHIIYRANLPRISLLYGFRHRARRIISDLVQLDIDLILCMMSTERELQFVHLIKQFGTLSERNLLLNRTSWWFASRLGENRNFTIFPKIYTASEDRERLLSQFARSSIKILLNAILQTYIRLPISNLFIGPKSCTIEQNIDRDYLEQLNQAYSEFFLYYDDAPLLIINCADIDL